MRRPRLSARRAAREAVARAKAGLAAFVLSVTACALGAACSEFWEWTPEIVTTAADGAGALLALFSGMGAIAATLGAVAFSLRIFGARL